MRSKHYDVKVDRDIRVPMRDGVHLATDIFYPEPKSQHERFPVLLFRTPYAKDESEATYGHASFFARHGYIVVQQDCRGCFKSEGEVNYLLPEAEDGYDTLGWIARQDWGDAEVGSWGTSWSGWTQTAMAALGPTRLRTMVPMMSGADGYTSSIRQGGALELRWMAWAFWHAAENTQRELAKNAETEEALVRPPKRFSDWLRQWPIRRGETQLARVPPYERWAFDLLNTEDRTSYWNHPALNPVAFAQAYADVSALYIGSWYDSYGRALFELYNAHRAVARRRVRLLVGPWVHSTSSVEQPFAGNARFTSDAVIDYKTTVLDWFDAELKGHNASDEAPIRLYVMGGGKGSLDPQRRLLHGGHWRTEESWPLARTHFRPYYLHANAALAELPASHEDDFLSFRYDPADPVPSIGGNVSSLLDVVANAPAAEEFHRLTHLERTVSIVAPGGYDQTVTKDTFRLNDRLGPLSARADVLVFETAPLSAPLEITGPVTVSLWVSSDAVDTDFTAKLIDVYPPDTTLPDGFALNLCDGIQRVRYRDGSGQAKLVTPGTIVPLTITLYPTSNIFAPGHRIRLDISSSNFPRFDLNANTGRHEDGVREGVIATNRVYCDRSRPSHIVLPVIAAQTS
jgi:putative CocE/NonD family hydrolase